MSKRPILIKNLVKRFNEILRYENKKEYQVIFIENPDRQMCMAIGNKITYKIILLFRCSSISVDDEEFKLCNDIIDSFELHNLSSKEEAKNILHMNVDVGQMWRNGWQKLYEEKQQKREKNKYCLARTSSEVNE